MSIKIKCEFKIKNGTESMTTVKNKDFLVHYLKIVTQWRQ